MGKERSYISMHQALEQSATRPRAARGIDAFGTLSVTRTVVTALDALYILIVAICNVTDHETISWSCGTSSQWIRRTSARPLDRNARQITMGTTTSERENDRLRRFYDKSAADYDLWMRHYDRWMLSDARERLCARAHGQTLEIGLGTGLNLGFYPPSVQLTGLDLSRAMLTIAAQRALDLGREVALRLGDAHALELPDSHFDTVVATLFVSSVPDERRAAAEAWRVLRPGGRLLLLDHVRSPIAPVRWAQRLLNPLMVRFAHNHLLRDPLDYLGSVGFVIEHCARSKWGIIEEVVARKDIPAPLS